jgi:glycosyltransferase involved in cell wall biosynthesis
VVPRYVRRYEATPRRDESVELGGLLRWALISRAPLELFGKPPPAALASFEAFVGAESYEFIWFSLPMTFHLLGWSRRGAAVLDCHDLNHFVHATRIENATPSPQRLRGVARRVIASLNIRRWKRYYRSVSGDVARIVVCSALDADRLRLPNTEVVPNGYPAPSLPSRPRRRAGRPVVLFPGTLTYPPNVDAAEFLVRDVLPLLKRVVPDVQIRLVGRAGHKVEALRSIPGVEVVGGVTSMEPELEMAAVVAVPIRFGSGTRLKILEAFAHRVPVVSTTLGAEGLGVVNGHSVLLADTAEEFALRCAQVVQDTDLASRLLAGGWTLYSEFFTAERVEERVAELAMGLSNPSSRS